MNTDRRSIRLKEFDYSTDGAYFVTICIQDRACLLGECVHGEFNPNGAGRMVESAWNELPVRFPHIQTDAFVVMPNHVHGIIMIQSPDRTGESCIRPKPPTHQGGHEDRPYSDDEYTGICTGESAIRPKPPTHQGDHEDRPYTDARTGESGIRPSGTLPRTLGRVLQAFKSITTVSYVDGVKQHGWQAFPGRLWQRNYYEHIVREDDDLDRIREYIIANPGQWDTDQDNPSVGANLVSPRNMPTAGAITRIAPTTDSMANGTRTGESGIRPEPPPHGGRSRGSPLP